MVRQAHHERAFVFSLKEVQKKGNCSKNRATPGTKNGGRMCGPRRVQSFQVCNGLLPVDQGLGSLLDMQHISSV